MRSPPARRAHRAIALAAAIALGCARALAQSPDDLYAQAERLLAAGQSEQAAALLKQALALDPKHWPSLCRMGEIDAAARRYPEAERSLQAAVEINPGAAPCWSRLAQVLLVSEKLPEAEKALLRAAELLPQDEGVLFNLARLYDTTQRPDEALAAYLRLLAAAPEGRRATGAHLRAARLLAQAHKPADAVDHYRAAVQGQPERPEIRAELGATLMAASRYDEALAEYDKVIAAGAADPGSLANAGSICLLKGDLTRAADLLDKAVAGAPKEIPPRIALATVLAQSGDHARAADVLKSVTQDDPRNPRAWFLLGQSLMKLGRTEEARQALERHRAIHEEIMKERMSAEPQAHP